MKRRRIDPMALRDRSGAGGDPVGGGTGVRHPEAPRPARERVKSALAWAGLALFCVTSVLLLSGSNTLDNLLVHGVADLRSTLTVAANCYFNGTLVDVDGNFAAGEDTTNTVTIAGGVSIGDSCRIAHKAMVGRSLDVDGTAILARATVQGTLGVSGNFTGRALVQGDSVRSTKGISAARVYIPAILQVQKIEWVEAPGGTLPDTSLVKPYTQVVINDIIWTLNKGKTGWDSQPIAP